MTRRQANNIYIKSHKAGEEIIKRLMLWDTKKSILENSRTIGIDEKNTRRFAHNMNLGYKKIGTGNWRKKCVYAEI